MARITAIIALGLLLAAGCSGQSEQAGEGTTEVARMEGAPSSTAERPIVIIETDSGAIVTEFFPDVAPVTCDSILSLVNPKFYDSLTFHRIIPGFVIQGGDPQGNGTGNPGFTLPAEFSTRLHLEGTLSMARGAHSIHSAGCQFFICLDTLQSLDNQYTVFGQVIEGIEVVRKLAAVPTGQMDRPQETLYIRRMYENK